MRGEDSDVLINLYRGAAQVPPWQGFLKRLADRATAVLLILPEGAKSSDFLIFSSGAQSLPFAAEALLRLRYQRVYAAEELSGARLLTFARILRVRVEGGGDAWLIVGRDMADIPAAFALMMSGLGPHLSVAVSHYLAQCRIRDHAALSHHLEQKFQIGVLVLNAAGLILTASPFALQILARSADVSGHIGAKLVLASADTLAQTLQNYDQGLDQAAVALQIPPLQILIQPYFGADHTGQNPTAVVHLRQSMRPMPNVAKSLSKMAQITVSEARFALKLVDGLTISEAGDALGLTLETSRNYSKQIYSKLDLRGQNDLIRFVLNSVIPLI